MIRPLLKHMTRSEIHAVMTGGFATIAGSVLAAYILFGVRLHPFLFSSLLGKWEGLALIACTGRVAMWMCFL